jgi:hypothetical protein
MISFYEPNFPYQNSPFFPNNEAFTWLPELPFSKEELPPTGLADDRVTRQLDAKQ